MFSLVEHHQTNRLLKAANKIIIAGLENRLEKAKRLWAYELHAILWAYHIIPHSSTKETSYRLVYRFEAMILIELTEPSLRTITKTKESNELARRAKLDLIEEDMEMARIKEEAIKQQMARKYNKKVNP